MPPRYTIVFEPEQDVYTTGCVLRGRVCLDLAEKINTKGIFIHITCKSVARWTRQKTIYFSKQRYLDKVIVLLAPENKVKQLSIGKYEFPFQVELDERLPSTFITPSFSFLTPGGRVFYTAKCIIQRSWSSDIVFKREFRVLRHFDLNKLTAGRQPVQMSDETNVCCLCCMSGPIHVDFTVDKQLYVPGEGIRVSAEVVNDSNMKTSSCSVNLIQETTLHGKDGASYTMSEIVASLVKPGVAAHKTGSWSDVLTVPPLTPSFLQGCLIIDLKHTLELHMSGIRKVMVVVIGSIPLSSTGQQEAGQ
ncbi:arrestin domain-containing protein 3-like isoform X1 [Physella acuta]|uniref:arrestin domain-containing protein 3-like isoform X1 n=1 Tax=Physella acuta TaxID=109671 RepID=UPI0027DCBA40|nr:arrestin domain-containing protein 3-like isoform X1 [Physella acuta]